MTKQLKFFFAYTLGISWLFVVVTIAAAQTPMMKRAETKIRVTHSVSKDIDVTNDPKLGLDGRRCIDGRFVKDIQDGADIIEYWVNLECSYCQVAPPVMAQRENPTMCIVVRHIPTKVYGESLKKALSYEALHTLSPNAANRYWENVIPKTNLNMPMPSEAALQTAMQEAAIGEDALKEALDGVATKIIETDIQAATAHITSTPTYVLSGIRFGSCDFQAADLPAALELAKKARAGDAEAKARVIEVITNGYMGEKML